MAIPVLQDIYAYQVYIGVICYPRTFGHVVLYTGVHIEVLFAVHPRFAKHLHFICSHYMIYDKQKALEK